MGRNFAKNYSNSSRFALHLLDNGYPFGKVENMQILHLNTKGFPKDMIEKFHIYKETISDGQLNDKDTVTPNKIFKTLIKN